MKTLLLFLLTPVLFYTAAFAQDKGLHIGQTPPELVYFSLPGNKTVTYKKDDLRIKFF